MTPCFLPVFLIGHKPWPHPRITLYPVMRLVDCSVGRQRGSKSALHSTWRKRRIISSFLTGIMSHSEIQRRVW